MANEKQINSRIQQKHDIEANWIIAGNAEKPFIPKVAEIIVYDCDENYDYERFKIGDGITNVIDLPFADEEVINKIEELKENIIIDVVDELPEEDINKKALYRLFTATFIHNRHVVDDSVCYIVDRLPEIGEPATNSSRTSIVAYYNLSDKKVYGYLDEILATSFGTYADHAVNIGWYEASLLFPLAGWSYAGVIDNIGEDPNDSTIRILLEKKVYIYQNEWIELTNSIVDEKLPTPERNGHFAYTIQRRDGVDAYELHLISHAINEGYENGELMYPYQIPLRDHGIIKTAEPKEDLDAANKKYVDAMLEDFHKKIPGLTTEGLSYTLSDDGAYYTCTGMGTATDTDIVIASEIDGKPVINIGEQAFFNCSSLTSVVIPDSVTSIGNGAFVYCWSLTSVVIPDSVESIGYEAFAGCDSLTSVVIPDSVTSIGERAFSGCSLLTIYCKYKENEIPEGWDAEWNYSNCPVVWGFANDFVGVNKKLNENYVPRMHTMDEEDGNAMLPRRYNRVYSERYNGRGVYSRYFLCMNPDNIPADPDVKYYEAGTGVYALAYPELVQDYASSFENIESLQNVTLGSDDTNNNVSVAYLTEEGTLKYVKNKTATSDIKFVSSSSIGAKYVFETDFMWEGANPNDNNAPWFARLSFLNNDTHAWKISGAEQFLLHINQYGNISLYPNDASIFKPNVWYNLRLEQIGTKVSLYVNDAFIWDYNWEGSVSEITNFTGFSLQLRGKSTDISFQFDNTFCSAVNETSFTPYLKFDTVAQRHNSGHLFVPDLRHDEYPIFENDTNNYTEKCATSVKYVKSLMEDEVTKKLNSTGSSSNLIDKTKSETIPFAHNTGLAFLANKGDITTYENNSYNGISASTGISFGRIEPLGTNSNYIDVSIVSSNDYPKNGHVDDNKIIRLKKYNGAGGSGTVTFSPTTHFIGKKAIFECEFCYVNSEYNSDVANDQKWCLRLSFLDTNGLVWKNSGSGQCIGYVDSNGDMNIPALSGIVIPRNTWVNLRFEQIGTKIQAFLNNAFAFELSAASAISESFQGLQIEFRGKGKGTEFLMDNVVVGAVDEDYFGGTLKPTIAERTLDGNINVPEIPVLPNHATSKNYVDTKDAEIKTYVDAALGDIVATLEAINAQINTFKGGE